MASKKSLFQLAFDGDLAGVLNKIAGGVDINQQDAVQHYQFFFIVSFTSNDRLCLSLNLPTLLYMCMYICVCIFLHEYLFYLSVCLIE